MAPFAGLSGLPAGVARVLGPAQFGNNVIHSRVRGKLELGVFAQRSEVVLERAAAEGRFQVRRAIPVGDVHQPEARLRGGSPVQPRVAEPRRSGHDLRPSPPAGDEFLDFLGWDLEHIDQCDRDRGGSFPLSYGRFRSARWSVAARGGWPWGGSGRLLRRYRGRQPCHR